MVPSTANVTVPPPVRAARKPLSVASFTTPSAGEDCGVRKRARSTEAGKMRRVAFMAEDFADGKFGLSAKLSHPFPEIGKQAVQVAARINGTMTQCGRRVKFSAELKQGRASVSPGECQSSLL